MIRPVFLLVALAACAKDTQPTDVTSPPTDDSTAPAPTTDADLLGDARIVDLVDRGALSVDLGEGREDPTVIDDALTLLVGAIDGLPAFDPDAGHTLSLTWLAKGEVGPVDVEDAGEAADPPTAPDPTEWVDGVDAFNAATRNEFRLVFSAGLLDAIGAYDAKNQLDLGTPGADETEDRESTLVPMAWSNGDDDRVQVYGTNAAVTLAAHERLVQLGGGCSGALVGPRHVVTAGHCLWSRTNQAWSDDFTVRAAANGTSQAAQVLVDDDDIPSGQVLWYYTPSQFRATTGSTWGFDYGILTIPGRLGDTVGWLGRVTYDDPDLDKAWVFRRGHPACAATFNGAPRIDVPAPCQPNHLYGNSAECDVGEFGSADAAGWERILYHSCDASGGDSGSALYVYHQGTPAVAAVHFFSACERTATDVLCTGTLDDRPLAAIRLTPEYRDLIGVFRGIFP